MPNYTQFLPSKNYAGSSGFYSDGSPITASPTRTSNTLTDMPVYAPDGSGLVISKNTGQPFSGVNPFDGQTYRGGKKVTPSPGKQFIPGTTTEIDPNNASQRYQAVEVQKNAPISAATGDLLSEFKKQAATHLNDFSAYLGDFKNSVQNAFKSGNAAADTSGTQSALANAQNRYSAALGQASGNAQQANADAAAREAALVAEAKNNLGLYDTAQGNIENLQLGQLGKQISRYKMASGSPNLGSDALAIAASGARDIAAPIELAKVNRRYDITNNLEAPIVQADAARSERLYQQFIPQIASMDFSSTQGTANAIQQLKTMASQLGYDNATRLFTAMNIPVQLQQQALGTDINQLAALNQLYSGSRYQGLQDILGTNVSQPVAYNVSTGGLPASPRYSTNVPITYTGQQNQPAASAPLVDPNAWANYTRSQYQANQNAMSAPSTPPRDYTDYNNQSWYNQFGG